MQHQPSDLRGTAQGHRLGALRPLDADDLTALDEVAFRGELKPPAAHDDGFTRGIVDELDLRSTVIAFLDYQERRSREGAVRARREKDE